jgi:hypothetical protein
MAGALHTAKNTVIARRVEYRPWLLGQMVTPATAFGRFARLMPSRFRLSASSRHHFASCRQCCANRLGGDKTENMREEKE